MCLNGATVKTRLLPGRELRSAIPMCQEGPSWSRARSPDLVLQGNCWEHLPITGGAEQGSLTSMQSFLRLKRLTQHQAKTMRGHWPSESGEQIL